jgi:nicotinate phosphoribosyltransferase
MRVSGMSYLESIYRSKLALLTDLYQLTMAYGYWRLGRADRKAAFHMFFRQAPFQGGFAVAAGIQPFLEFVERFQFSDSDIEYLQRVPGSDGDRLFDDGFLDYLRTLELTCDIDAVREGEIVFGQEPLIRVTGPLLQCQLIETALLNIVNFQTLVATKAARIASAARGTSVLEFGLRRAQGIDGGVTASRAAYIGGCAATSNVLAGQLHDLPVRGTHAHSWVMCFDDELRSFEAYAEAMPGNCVFLVDTYDTLQGVRHAIEVGRQLRARGHEMRGVRLDSGDLADLSRRARALLDEAGFEGCAIVASNDLDEHLITSLKQQGAAITVWGVGTRLATAYDQPALGGVYKLTAMQDEAGTWQPKIKLSEQAAKTTIPGIQQVRRFETESGLVGDVIFDERMGLDPQIQLIDIQDPNRHKKIPHEAQGTDLLIPAVRDGAIVLEPEPLADIRTRSVRQLNRLHPSIRRLLHPHEYPVGLDLRLQRLRQKMIQDARGTGD